MQRKLPRIDAKRADKACKGVDVVSDTRQAPLKPCGGKAVQDGHFCARHEKEHDRQTRLLAVLKRGWQGKLQGKRGRQADDERALPATQAKKALAPLPEIKQARNPADAWPAQPRPKPTPTARLTAVLPTLADARRKLTGSLD